MESHTLMDAELLTYDEIELARALSGMSVRAMTAFAGSCACRIATAAECRGANMSLALQAIDQLRNFAEGGAIANGGEIEARLSASILSEDEAPEFDASIVEDAFAAATYGLRCATSGDAMYAVWASRRAYDTVDRYAGLRQNGAEFTEPVEAAILSHPVVQSELRRQRRDLRNLGEMRDNPMEIATLIDRARREPLFT